MITQIRNKSTLFTLIAVMGILVFQSFLIPVYSDSILTTIAVGDNPQGVAVNEATNRIYTADNDGDTVTVVNGATNEIITTIDLAVDATPFGIAVNEATNRIYTADAGNDTVTVINGDTNGIITTIGVGSIPADVAVNEETNRIYVTNFGGDSISVINGDTNGIITTIDLAVDATPFGITVNEATNRIYTADSGNDTVTVINGETNGIVTTIALAGLAGGIAVNETTNRVYVPTADADTVTVIDGATNGIITTIAVGSSPFGITVNEATNRIYVNDAGNDTVTIIDGSDNTVFQILDISPSDTSSAVAVNETTGRIYVTDQVLDEVIVIQGDVPSTSGGGGGANGHLTRPTFGLDHNTFNQLVEGGFSFNGVSHDITDNWWTPFAEQEVKIGTMNSFTTKVFADKQLRVQEFLFGIPQVGDAHKAELGIEIFYDYSGEIEAINVVQKSNVIDVNSVQVVNSNSKCVSDEDDEKCVTTHLSMKFLEPLKDKIMAIKAIDFKGRTHITYLNEGFDISGDSLNPMQTKMINSREKYEGLMEVTQTAKYSNIWTAQDGREFQINSYGSAKQINQSFENDSNLMDKRFSSEFADYKKSLTEKYAELLLESCPACFESFADFDDSFAYEISNVDRMKKIIHLIEIEQQKAQQVLDDAQLDVSYPDAEIDLDDRPISVILAEERAMKKILVDERAYLKQVIAPQQ